MSRFARLFLLASVLPACGALMPELAGNQPAHAQAPAKPAYGVLAVLELKSKLTPAEAAGIDAGYLSNVLRSKAVEKVPGLKVITKENMLTLVQAQGKTLEQCEGECEVDTGRMLGADAIISGELLKFGSRYKIDLRLHDTKEGRLLVGAQASGRNADELDEDLDATADKLLAPLIPAQPVAQTVDSNGAPQAAPEPANQAGPAGVPVSPMPPGAFLPVDEKIIFEAKCPSDTACMVQKKCEEQHTQCGQFAFGYYNGAWEMPRNARLGLSAYWLSCVAGSPIDCWWTAHYLGTGDGAPADKPRALLVDKRACELGYVQACTEVRDGTGKQADRAHVDKILQNLCDRSEAAACSARVVTDAPAGVSTEPGTLGFALYAPCGGQTACYIQKKCREEKKECGTLAGAYAEGQFDVQRDPALANLLYQAACDAADENACVSLARRYDDGSGTKKNQAKALEIFRASCAREYVFACQALGADPKSSAGDKAHAKATLDKLCDGGDDTACAYAGRKKK